MRALASKHLYKLHYFFSNKFVYATVQRNADGVIVASASSIEKTLRESLPSRTDVAAAARIGALLAERAKPVLGSQTVAFEKPRGKPYHGKMKALVDNVRAGGVKV